MKKTIKRLSLLAILAAVHLPALAAGPQTYYDIRNYGAKPDARRLNTAAINGAINDCTANGGGIVVVPKGTFVTGTIHLKDNVRLRLHQGAVLKATTDLDKYDHYTPLADVSQYDSGDGSQNANSSQDARWNRALILGVGISNAAIEGEGIIDGGHLFDPLGEEKMRGPHTVVIAESRNFTMSGVTVNNAANYAVMSYRIEHCLFENLTMNEGWDGIHIRGGKNIVIRNCDFYTGDDAIAGGYWENMVITDCYINSSCNGIRMIMPSDGLTVSHSKFEGPGRYPHRTSGELNRTNMLVGIFLQPGGWGKAEGTMRNIHIHDIEMDNLDSPLMMVLHEGNEAERIVIERVKATRMNHAGATMESWRGGTYSDVVFRDLSFSFRGNPDPTLRDVRIGHASGDSRPLPAWAWYINNTRSALFENVSLEYTGGETRPAFWFENSANVKFRNVTWKETPGVQQTVLVNSAGITVQ